MGSDSSSLACAFMNHFSLVKNWSEGWNLWNRMELVEQFSKAAEATVKNF